VSPLVAEGYARAKALTLHHAKSFSFASRVLFGARRRAAFALYAFCRRLDDVVDGDNLGDGTVVVPDASPEALAARLELARAAVRSLYAADATVRGQLPWHEAEFAAFRDAVERFGIPQQPFLDLIDGMEMDLTRSRYQTFAELELYCYRVAGVVGLMMAPVLGCRDARALPFAADLGTAMQLTNILRDVKEDLARGRVYLPHEELAAFGLTEADLAAGCCDERWQRFMQFQVKRARGLYARAAQGIPSLSGFGSQRVVRLMAVIYGQILDVIEARQADVFTSRPRVTTAGKLWLAGQVLLTPNPRAPALLEAGATP
jgi:phytoene synthase